jgi:DNA polymerase V
MIAKHFMTTTVEMIGSLDGKSDLQLPILLQSIDAGFPSPADDHIEKSLNINDHLITHPQATFLMRVRGDSMEGAGIHEGDIVIIDCTIEPVHGKIVVAEIDGDLTLKRLYRINGTIKLLPENPKFKEIEIKNESELKIWGVVKNVIKFC